MRLYSKSCLNHEENSKLLDKIGTQRSFSTWVFSRAGNKFIPCHQDIRDKYNVSNCCGFGRTDKAEKHWYKQVRDTWISNFIMALDQGTTSCRAILFDKEGHMIGSSSKEFQQIYPCSAVEHDPEEVWQNATGGYAQGS